MIEVTSGDILKDDSYATSSTVTVRAAREAIE